MKKSTLLKAVNGLTSALLVAPILTTATTVLGQELDNNTDKPDIVTIYENDFNEESYPDDVLRSAGNPELIWSDAIETDGELNTGVWVTNRENDYDGIDIPFEAIGVDINEGVDYSVQVLGFISEDEEIPEGISINLETADGYTWLHSLPAEHGTFELNATYNTDNAKEEDNAFRIKTNEGDMEFAITNILITSETSVEEPTESELSPLYHETFSDSLGLTAQAGGATLTHLPEFKVNNKTGAVHITNRVDNHDGLDIPFEEIGMEIGYEYNLTVHGYVDEGEEPDAGDQIVIQLPKGDYPVLGGTEVVPGEEFVVSGSHIWTDEEYESFRVQTSWVDGGRESEVSFYITEILVEWNPNQDVGGEDEIDEDLPPAKAFTFIDFENGELNGFEGRSGDEILEITDEHNNTPDGMKSLYVRNRQNNWHGPSLEVTPYINPGKTYEVSVWVKVDTESTQTINLSTQVGDGSSAAYNTIGSVDLNAENGWVEIKGDYRYTSLGGGFVSIYVESSNVELDFYVDDVSFNEIDSDPIEVEYDLTPIKELYKDHFSIGNAISFPDLEGERLGLLTHHHSLVTAENALKPGEVYNGREFDFAGADVLVERIADAGLEMHGHVLVWHSQSPEWHHTDDDGNTLSREEALDNMHTHIRTVMEHFGGLQSWDVVNEALDGSWENPENWKSNLRNTGWKRALGDDYIYEAFRYARQVADENGWHDMVLYYNDYNDHVQPKARTMYYMIKDINEQWAAENPDEERKLISGVGMQGHYNININPDTVKESIERFETLGIDIGITELDVTTITENVYSDEEIQRQAYIYARLFQIFREHSDSIDRVTLWGLNDANSWRSERYPLLFDGSLRAKPAYHAIADPEAFIEAYDAAEPEANQGYGVYGTPEIDAEIDEMWQDAPALNMNRMQQAHEINARGTGRVLWDEENLYILYQVTDSILDVSAEEAHEQDSVEAFVNETGQTTTSFVDGVGQYRVNYENVASFNPSSYSEGFVSATHQTDSGYIVEMAIPWKGTTPIIAGHTLGFDIQINDAREGERHGVGAWNDMTGQGWSDPTVFGQLTLLNSMDDIDGDEKPEEDTIVEVEEGVQTPILPGQTVVLPETDVSIDLPIDLPLGTEIIIELITEEDLPELDVEGDYTLVVAGEVVQVTLVYPEGEEDFEGEFELTLGINEDFVGEDVYVYYYNEETNLWEQREAEILDATITTNVMHFSIYGVFAQVEDEANPDPDPDNDVEEPDGTDVEEDGGTEEESDLSGTLPQTATATWTIGLIGVTGLISGAGIHFIRKRK